MKDTVEFGLKIKELRLKNDYSLRDLAARSGVSYSFISSIEKGRFSPSRETVVSLAEALKGANKDDLLLLAGFAPDNIDEVTTRWDENTLKRLTEEKIIPYGLVLQHLPRNVQKEIFDDVPENEYDGPSLLHPVLIKILKELSLDDLQVLNQMKKYPVFFNDLASDPAKLKKVIKMWEFIQSDIENDNDEEPED
ncbi:helix-turn-helix domain-containing protein [Brevibacillus centrosporus]|uniref:helix-turn-helix domain-containing protein n=1 Tax=Brevibacillus centrosporus TaxID=54910 RepID=UPI00398727AD